jgi:hypothetical protein
MKLLTLSISIVLSAAVMANVHSRDSIAFDYTFEKIGQLENVIQVTAALTNHSNNWFYFLSESCNGLDYNITTTSPKAIPYTLVHFNA